jgi:hypothetical protein
MERLVCAMFDDHDRASAAVDRLLDSGVERSVVSALLHEGEIVHGDVPEAGNESVRRGVRGALLGGGLGALLGVLVAGPVGLVGAGPLALALFAVGSMYGGLAGAISGRDEDKPSLAALAEQLLQPGKVLVTVEIEGRGDVDQIEAILTHSGGRRVQLA